MAHVIFYEKPGCVNNTKQKALLIAAGHSVEAHNLLTTPWTAEQLRLFFGSLSIKDWFNVTAPRIKSGEIIPSELNEETALALMVEDPILIRRPLMQIGDLLTVGFNLEQVNTWVPLNAVELTTQDLETCPRSHSN